MARVCKCHTDDKARERQRQRQRMTGAHYHEHRCECPCECNHDTLGYKYCPYCHFQHAKMRGDRIGILGLAFKEW